MAKKKDIIEMKRQSIIAKLVFIGVLILLVFVTNVFLTEQKHDIQVQKKEEVKDKESTEGILGKSIFNNLNDKKALEAETKNQITELKKQADILKKEFESTSEKYIAENKEEVEEKATDFIYKNTLKPLLDKINNLPENQRDYILENVCKDYSQ